MTITAERLAAVGAELGEGPLWHAEQREVVWVDILAGEVHACALDGTDRIAQRHAQPVGAVALTAAGEVLAATPTGLRRADGTLVAALPAGSPDLRMNDGKADPAGRFVGGTMTIGEARAGAGSLWSLGGGETSCLVAEATIPNGLAWSSDGKSLYWIDTPTRRIDVFDYDVGSGQVHNRRAHAEIDPEWGDPDGMCVDAEGGLWVAMWGGGAVRRFVDGRCDAVVEVPTPLVTCPAFAGDSLDTLVITTASIDLDDRPMGAGDLYMADVGVAGVAPARLGRWAT